MSAAVVGDEGLRRTFAWMASYVLVPGAGGDDRYWRRLVPALRERGHDAIAVALPAADDSAGWSEYADAIVDAIDDRPEPVLVAQSLGGFSAPLACERKPVTQIVLLNAMIPKPGETGEAWWSNTGQREAQLEYLSTIGVTPEEASDDKVLYFHDVPPDVVAEAERRGEPGQSWTPMTQRWPLASWPATPTRVLVGRDDRLFPEEFQRRVARERLGIEAETIPGGHLVALADPEGLADRLIRTAPSRP
ncbi:MAG TPA: alpha/beta hydrolase [Actinomycetota bacterium]